MQDQKFLQGLSAIKEFDFKKFEELQYQRPGASSFDQKPFEIETFMGKVKVRFNGDRSIRYEFEGGIHYYSKKNIVQNDIVFGTGNTRFQLSLLDDPKNKEVFSVYLQNGFYYVRHKENTKGSKIKRTMESPIDILNKYLKIIFSKNGILNEDFSINQDLISDVSKNLNFIQFLFLYYKTTQNLINFLSDPNILGEKKGDLIKSLINFQKNSYHKDFQKNSYHKPLFEKIFKYNKNKENQDVFKKIGDDFIKILEILLENRIMHCSKTEILKEIATHRDQKIDKNFFTYLAVSGFSLAIKCLRKNFKDIKSQFKNEEEVKNNIEEFFNLKQFFNSQDSANIDRDVCKELFKFFKLIEDPELKKQYFKEVFLSDNQTFFRKIIESEDHQLADIFFDKFIKICCEEGDVINGVLQILDDLSDQELKDKAIKKISYFYETKLASKIHALEDLRSKDVHRAQDQHRPNRHHDERSLKRKKDSTRSYELEEKKHKKTDKDHEYKTFDRPIINRVDGYISGYRQSAREFNEKDSQHYFPSANRDTRRDERQEDSFRERQYYPTSHATSSRPASSRDTRRDERQEDSFRERQYYPTSHATSSRPASSFYATSSRSASSLHHRSYETKRR